MPEAILFGSTGVLAETSDLQRQTFKRAFVETGLNWTRSEADCSEMLASPDRQEPVARHAEERSESVDAAAIHAAKASHFGALLHRELVASRTGVAETMAADHRARNRGRILEALKERIDTSRFEVVIDRTQAPQTRAGLLSAGPFPSRTHRR